MYYMSTTIKFGGIFIHLPNADGGRDLLLVYIKTAISIYRPGKEKKLDHYYSLSNDAITSIFALFMNPPIYTYSVTLIDGEIQYKQF